MLLAAAAVEARGKRIISGIIKIQLSLLVVNLSHLFISSSHTHTHISSTYYERESEREREKKFN
jgi:hypothetical protein